MNKPLNDALHCWNTHRQERWNDAPGYKRMLKKVRRKAARRVDQAVIEEALQS